MNIRLQQLITAEGLNNRRFAEKMGIQSSNVSHIVNGRNKPGYDFIARMLEIFPNINPYWLILGQGDMYKESSIGGTSHTVGIGKEHEFNTDSHKTEHSKTEISDSCAGRIDCADINQTKIEFDNDNPRDYSPQLSKDIDMSPRPAKQSGNSLNMLAKVGETIDQIVIFYSDGTFKTYTKQ